MQELKILVVDDAGVMRALIAHWLNKMVYCKVTQAADGLEAIRALHAAGEEGAPYDLIVTDLKMPHVDGTRLVEYVRGKLADEGLPIIVVTSIADPGIRERALSAGATTYITKPLKYYELLRAMLRLFGKNYQEVEKPLAS